MVSTLYFWVLKVNSSNILNILEKKAFNYSTFSHSTQVYKLGSCELSGTANRMLGVILWRTITPIQGVGGGGCNNVPTWKTKTKYKPDGPQGSWLTLMKQTSMKRPTKFDGVKFEDLKSFPHRFEHERTWAQENAGTIPGVSWIKNLLTYLYMTSWMQFLAVGAIKCS